MSVLNLQGLEGYSTTPKTYHIFLIIHLPHMFYCTDDSITSQSKFYFIGHIPSYCEDVIVFQANFSKQLSCLKSSFKKYPF